GCCFLFLFVVWVFCCCVCVFFCCFVVVCFGGFVCFWFFLWWDVLLVSAVIGHYFLGLVVVGLCEVSYFFRDLVRVPCWAALDAESLEYLSMEMQPAQMHG
ncbi:hypothetical protein, partial [Pseudomonas syringae group genomosp. 7]|uniref:hypothetical protein n=1 Tax=Pseudomonas syringae group genomosp. 7 TaxID=251699 RepID=UPI00376F911E